MHHVRIALDAHEVPDLDLAEAGHPADVVPRQIHEHHVLGALLLVGEQFGRQRRVFLGSGAAGPGPRDRAGLDHPVFGAGHHLGRCSGHHQAVEVEVVHVRRRVHHPERAVEVERVDGERRLETLGRHDLDDVPGAHVVLGAAHHLEVPVPARVGGGFG